MSATSKKPNLVMLDTASPEPQRNNQTSQMSTKELLYYSNKYLIA